MEKKDDVYIVYTVVPDGDTEAFYIRTLVNAFRSEEAAREALIYTYKHAASGFSAKLTAQQASQVLRQPGVLQVVPSMRYHHDMINHTSAADGRKNE